jgi:hypothetical protein
MTCEPDRHYWAQEGPMTVACEDCEAQGTIRLVTRQVANDNSLFKEPTRAGDAE